MNIKTLRVQNFKNFEDKTFEFSEGFNLIVGDNGTGKTAVLDALAVGLGGYLNPIDQKPTRHIRANEILQKSFLSGQIYTFEQQYPVQIEIAANFPEESITWKRSTSLNSIGAKRTTTKNITKHAKEIQKNISQGKKIIIPIVAHYTTGRLWVENESKSSNLLIRVNPVVYEDFMSKIGSSRLSGYEDALNIAINRKKILFWFARMEFISLQNKEPIQIFEAVKKAVKDCIEGCEAVYFDVNLREPIAKINGKAMPLSLLSDGQRGVLAMIADIAYRMAQLNPHLLENVTLETPGVVLIDELDLHLHPKWQRTIVDNLRKTFPKVQFIATSHSPFIIQSLRPGELIDLNEVEGAAQFQNQSIEDIVEKVQGVDLPQLSERKQQMFDAATEYYKVLEKAKAADSVELEHLKSKLDELIMPFSEDMAYQAFLRMERLAAIGEKG